jgi:hypothetical protein
MIVDGFLKSVDETSRKLGKIGLEIGRDQLGALDVPAVLVTLTPTDDTKYHIDEITAFTVPATAGASFVVQQLAAEQLKGSNSPKALLISQGSVTSDSAVVVAVHSKDCERSWVFGQRIKQQRFRKGLVLVGNVETADSIPSAYLQNPLDPPRVSLQLFEPDEHISKLGLAYGEDLQEFFAENFGTDLDFSLESLAHVEAVSSIMNEQYLLLRDLPEETVRDFCMMFGGYLGEVARRQYEYEWGLAESGHHVFYAMRDTQTGRVVRPFLIASTRLTVGGDVLAEFVELASSEP